MKKSILLSVVLTLALSTISGCAKCAGALGGFSNYSLIGVLTATEILPSEFKKKDRQQEVMMDYEIFHLSFIQKGCAGEIWDASKLPCSIPISSTIKYIRVGERTFSLEEICGLSLMIKEENFWGFVEFIDSPNPHLKISS